MKVYIAPYKMQLKPGWSRHHSGEGVLIKVEDQHQNFGFADLHPWESSGDQPITEQMQLLKNGCGSSLLQRSLQLAQDDLYNRKHKVKVCVEGFKTDLLNTELLNSELSSTGLFHADKNIFAPIQNHQLEMSLSGFYNKMLIQKTTDRFAQAACLVKVKIGSDLQRELETLNELFKRNSKITWRLDFNESLNFTEFLEFWKALNLNLQKQVQFCEDPVAWNLDHWQRLRDLGVPLAADRVLDRQLNFVGVPTVQRSTVIMQILELSSFIVLKPAQRDCCSLLAQSFFQGFLKSAPTKKIVVTSYLDHPIGIMHAYHEALKIYQIVPHYLCHCGLASMVAYEDTDFNIVRNIQTVKNSEANEFGVGFQQELERQNWIYCSQF